MAGPKPMPLADLEALQLGHKDEVVESVEDLLKHLATHNKSQRTLWFRGHHDRKWRLSPWLLRSGKATHEFWLRKQFEARAIPHLERGVPADWWEWMFLMAHYGVPTRLLDWTENPLVGLHFAVEKSQHDDQDAALWVLDPIKLNSFNPRVIKGYETDIPLIGLNEGAAQTPRPADYQGYSPHELPDLQTGELRDEHPLAVRARHNSARIRAQQGVFTIFGGQDHDLREYIPAGSTSRDHVWRYIIPSDAKDDLRDQLNLLHLTDDVLFPELSRLGARLAFHLEEL